MKVLVVGGGGREHALVWKIKQSPRVKQVFCAPGNAGIAEDATCVNIGAEDIPALLNFACEKGIDLTVVGPEAPLAAGIVDSFRNAGLKIFGPAKQAAALESSKAEAKEFMSKYKIPTARYKIFDDAAGAEKYIRESGAPCVVKADGLAAGKGVVVCESEEEALQAVDEIMVKKKFGAAGNRVVIEEKLTGEEVSVLAFTDGTSVVPMVSSQDHKQIYEGDKGPNTGGMGAYAPAPVYTPEVHRDVMEKILKPAVRGMREEGRPYEGVLYAGLMVTEEGPKVLEFNVRFGDPEAQPVLTLLESDLVEIMEAVVCHRLQEAEVKWKEGASVCVVLASAGYPGSYEKGKVIRGLDDVSDAVVFHAGTARRGNDIVTSGGRVLGVTATGRDIRDAVRRAYAAVDKISFEGMYCRRDIGYKALKR